MSKNPKIRGFLTFTLVFTLTVVGLLISMRTPPATVEIYKLTTPAPKPTDIGDQTPVFADNTSITPQQSDTVSENDRMDSAAETDAFDDFNDILDDIEVKAVSQPGDGLAPSPFGFGDFPDI